MPLAIPSLVVNDNQAAKIFDTTKACNMTGRFVGVCLFYEHDSPLVPFLVNQDKT